MSEQHKPHENSGEHHIPHIPHHEVTTHHERLQEHHEKAAEKSKSETAHEQERALYEVQEKAISGAEYPKPLSEKLQPDAPLTKADKEHGFNTIMHHVRQNMSQPERTFSKLIHTPAVEKTSEALGKTIARPSGLAGAAIAAFIGLLSVYSIAKFAGFQLSGSEMPLLLVAGFAVGLFVEWVIKSLRSIFVTKNQ